MQKSKLISIIKALSAKEQKALGEFLESPYFNKNGKVLALYQYILKFQSKNFEHPRLNKEVVYKNLFKGTAFSDQKIRNLMRKLAALLEQFLIQQEFEEAKHTKERFLLGSYMKRYLDKQYAQQQRMAQKDLDEETCRDKDFYYHQYMLSQHQYSFNLYQRADTLKEDLQQVLQNLDYYYIASKLRYCCAMLNMQRVISIESEVPFLDEILNYLENNPIPNIPAIGFFYRLFLLIRDGKEEQYFDLKELLVKEAGVLPKTDLRYINIGVFNYCNVQLKNGKTSFLREIFELFKLALTHELYLEDGYITPPGFYRNVTMAALRLGELKWAGAFIEEYREKLHPDVRDNYYSYCLAAVHFYKQEYRQTVLHLLAFDFQHPYQYMEHKVLLAKTYYELEEEDALEALLHATRIYLHRDTIFPDHIKDAYKNYIRVLSRLIRVRYAPNEEKQQVVEEVKSIEPLEDKEWLYEKIEAFVEGANV